MSAQIASRLGFPRASFDAAVSRWGIIFEPDAEAVAARIRRFLKPGARIAISSWGEPDQVPFLSIPMRTTMERLNVPPPPAGTPGPLSRRSISLMATLQRLSAELRGTCRTIATAMQKDGATQPQNEPTAVPRVRPLRSQTRIRPA